MQAVNGRRRELFPAWAGVIPVKQVNKIYSSSVPRMGGGDPGH